MWARLFPFAWSGASATPTRGRPARPIAFTPSRGQPVPPPPRPPAATPSATARLAQAGVWLLLALGWATFIAWWVIVLRREQWAALGYAAGVIAAILLTSAAAMTLWTRHNIRVARKGRRGRSSLYIPMRFERDTFGRSLELPAPALATAAAEVRVELRDGVKAYVVAGEGRQ